ncbi:hypothetical protein CL657_02850 [bacterium]|nr:hypothetical protein [bacterium]|tara:strand:- start:18707 stop:19888 length:1182 start_codon:yes stop_codon:yes gene_type:complete
MKQFIFGILFIFLTTAVQGGIQYQLSDFMKEDTAAGFGYVNIDNNSYFKANINPNFNLKGLQVGLGIDLYIPMGDYGYPKSADWLTLRYLGYDYQKKHGFKYGRLSNVTLGQGLLVDGFDTGSGGTSEFNNQKTGFLGYLTVLKTKVTALQTAQNVQGLRVERPLLELASTPVIVGATYMRDEDGVNDDSSGTLVTRPAQDGYAADVSYPIGGQFFTLYTEYAKLVDHGQGVSSGARGTFFDIVDYKAEYRVLGTDFVPGYFNNAYQSTAFNFSEGALKEQVSGVLVNATSDIMGEYAKAGLQYELYDDVNVLTAALGWKQIGPVTGVLNYSKPFNSENNNAILVGDFYYRTAKFYDLVIRVKRVYVSSNEFTESVGFSVVFKIDRLLPNLPI